MFWVKDTDTVGIFRSAIKREDRLGRVMVWCDINWLVAVLTWVTWSFLPCPSFEGLVMNIYGRGFNTQVMSQSWFVRLYCVINVHGTLFLAVILIQNSRLSVLVLIIWQILKASRKYNETVANSVTFSMQQISFILHFLCVCWWRCLSRMRTKMVMRWFWTGIQTMFFSCYVQHDTRTMKNQQRSSWECRRRNIMS